MSWRAGVVVAALLVCGCPGVTRPLERPRLHLVEVAAAMDADPDAGVVIAVGFRAVNANAIAVHARALDWALAMGGAVLVRGRVELDQIVPAHGSATIDIELPMAAAGDMAARLRSGQRDYRLQGTMHFASERGDISAVFDERGTIAPPQKYSMAQPWSCLVSGDSSRCTKSRCP